MRANHRPGRRVVTPSRLTVSGIAISLMAMLFAAACDIPAEPTPTPTMPIIPASPTVDPLAPVGDENALDAIAALGTRMAAYTPSAPELAPDGRSTLTPTPQPTDAFFRLSFGTIDGLSLAATFYGAARRPAPTVILLHDAPGARDDWAAFAIRLQQANVDALAVDLRGFGDTGGVTNWAKLVGDMQNLFTRLRALPGIDPSRISFLGSGIGANAAIVACAAIPDCRSVGAISPQPDSAGINVSGAMTALGKRPVLLAAARDEGNSAVTAAALGSLAQGDHRVLLYDGHARGVRLLETQPTLSEIVIRWFGGEFQ